jgi:hypothetical protein
METGDTWRVWSDLRRKEADLKWCGHQPAFGQQYDSMGRPADASRYGWGHEQMARVDRVRKALSDSGPSAQIMIARSLSGINLSAIWPILISVCEDIALYYGGSVITGGLLGGVGGAFFGGVGAVPGAAAGAAAGSYIGGGVLSLLGLKSLVEGVVQSVPDAMEYYRKGCREAWGPTSQDRQSDFSMTATGSASSAATYLANGHVIMVTTILSVLVAYVTRGKGDKATLLKEIGHSPRLGPKVAQWVEQNEEKLRHHPLLRRRGSGGVAHEEPPPPPRRGSGKEPERPGPTGMPKKTVPCFKTNGLPQGSVPEFERQLSGQETGINNMTVDEYLKGREAFDAKKSGRDPKLARDARADYHETLKRKLTRELQAKGLSLNGAKIQAAKMAVEKMKALAALHIPDMVAGGKDVISAFGDRNVNSRIGAQWKKGGRLTELDKAANAIPEAMRASMKMNAKLERCK